MVLVASRCATTDFAPREAYRPLVGAVVRDAQSGVDDLIAEHPELAAYASEVERMPAESAPEAYRSLDEAGDQLGC